MKLIIILASAILLSGCRDNAATSPAFEMGALDISHRGATGPEVPFIAPDGRTVTLAAYRGRPLIVNLWATWCAPCVSEMPALDKLADREGDRVQVLAVSQDSDGAKAVAPFFARMEFEHLQPYLDPPNRIGIAIGSDTLPTTIFYDASGHEAWRVLGAMNWNGERAQTLIKGTLGG